jgi:alpha-methylacyl-CoA racemase
MSPSTSSSKSSRGPLAGLRVVEIAGIGPGPFACMLLSDMGADVLTVARPGERPDPATDVIGRGRTLMTADLKDPAAVARVLALVAQADVLVEGFRPGVMERLGLGPEETSKRNPRLIYARMTGWGQDGPLSKVAGHDLNYISIAGALDTIGPAGGAPVPPLNLVGDYGGGSLYLVVGILAALHESQRSGKGQVVDAAICDGVVSLMSLFVTARARGQAYEQRGKNLLDGGAPFYSVYITADDKYVSVGAIEPQFFAELCRRTGVAPALWDAQHDRSRWPSLRAEFERLFRGRTRDEWNKRLGGTDCCFAPVLSLDEASRCEHNVARKSFVEVAGMVQPAPAPRFSRTPSSIQGPAPTRPVSADEALGRWSTGSAGLRA